MFCDPAYVSSLEYHAFWAKLNCGKSDTGVHKWIGKEGKGNKDVWMQASYNPILAPSADL